LSFARWLSAPPDRCSAFFERRLAGPQNLENRAEILAAADALETAGDPVFLKLLRMTSGIDCPLARRLAEIATGCRKYAQSLRYREILFRTLLPDEAASDTLSLAMFFDDVLALVTAYGDAGLHVSRDLLLQRLEGIVTDTFQPEKAKPEPDSSVLKLIKFYEDVGNWSAARQVWELCSSARANPEFKLNRLRSFAGEFDFEALISVDNAPRGSYWEAHGYWGLGDTTNFRNAMATSVENAGLVSREKMRLHFYTAVAAGLDGELDEVR
jgi:hypothetical protein